MELIFKTVILSGGNMTEKLYGNPEQMSLFEKPKLDTSPADCDTIYESFWNIKHNNKKYKGEKS